MATAAIRAEGLAKRFGKTRALDGVDLVVEPGTILGLLGPNGAGKTTIVRILTTLLRPDAGTARVDGFDVVRQGHEVRRRIGLAGQQAAVDEYLTGRANLVMMARHYHMPAARARARGRAARAARARRRGRPPGPHVLRRHAAPARPGCEPGRGAADHLPGRADDRP